MNLVHAYSRYTTITINLQRSIIRTLTRSNVCQLREIIKTTSKDGKTITVEGTYVNSPRREHLIDFDELHSCKKVNAIPSLKMSELTQIGETNSKKCPLCKFELPVKHTDVLILSQFLDTSGLILPKSVSGLCHKQHKRMGYLIEMAKLAGILKTDKDPEPTLRANYLKYNKYYEESVIDEFLAKKRNKA